MTFPGLNQYWAEDKVSGLWTQHSAVSESWTSHPLISSLAFYHWAISLLILVIYVEATVDMDGSIEGDMGSGSPWKITSGYTCRFSKKFWYGPPSGAQWLSVRVLNTRRAVGSSLTGVTMLCLWARHINPCLVLVQPRKTRPDITERLLTGT